ncbi:hypothetical protein ILUMI_12757, partial [Ignelater luminosus]
MWTNLFKFILLTLVGSFAYTLEGDELENSFRQGLEDYIHTGKMTAELNDTIEILQLPNLFHREDKRPLKKVACLACNTAIGTIIRARRNGADKKQLMAVLETMCVSMNIVPQPVCHGAITIHAESLIYMVDNKEDLTSQRMCSILLQELNCKDRNRQDWTIDIPPPTSKSVAIKQKQSESKPLKVLQLTDFHYDPGYEVGSDAKCDSPLCCQKGSKPSDPEHSAGYWTDYRNCDTPWHMLVDSIDHIVAQHKDIDVVYFTGDIINHKVWETDVAGNSEAIRDVLRYLKKSFGTTPIYPILGNHEPHPVNLFSSEGVEQPQLNSQWVYDLSAEEWKAWLPEETRDSILKGGFYTTLIKPGFRIVGLNSNFCYHFNWWLFYDDVDPYGQLQWLVEVLLKAEENNEIVHILSHIPTGGGNCLFNWSREYSRIINRFAHIITAQFNGHTHFDDTVIFFNTSNPGQAINVAFNGGSLTAYSNLNPNYVIYEVDSDNFEVLDYESWAFNLTEANLYPNLSPNWYKLYSFKHAYGVKDLSPQELAMLTERMAKTPALTELYFRLKHKESDVGLATGCNNACEIDNLCTMVTSHAENTLHCEILTEIYNS